MAECSGIKTFWCYCGLHVLLNYRSEDRTPHLAPGKSEEFAIVANPSLLHKEKMENREPKLSWVLLIDRPCDEGQCALKIFSLASFSMSFWSTYAD